MDTIHKPDQGSEEVVQVNNLITAFDGDTVTDSLFLFRELSEAEQAVILVEYETNPRLLSDEQMEAIRLILIEQH